MKTTNRTKLLGTSTYKGLIIKVYHAPRFNDFSFCLVNPTNKRSFTSDPIYSSKTEVLNYAKSYINTAIKIKSSKSRQLHREFVSEYNKIFK